MVKMRRVRPKIIMLSMSIRYWRKKGTLKGRAVKNRQPLKQMMIMLRPWEVRELWYTPFEALKVIKMHPPPN